MIDQEYREYRKDGRRVREISRRTKNGKSRRIYPPKEVFEYLERQKALQEKMRLKHPDLWNNPYGLVFTDEYGGWITRTIQESQYGKAREEAGFPLLRFHDLRHVGAHYKYEQTHDLWAVRDYLGHRFLGMTIQYLFTSRQKEENIRKLDDYYRGLLKQGGDGKND